jgi:hypothetical protein
VNKARAFFSSRLARPERILPLTCLVSAAVLFGSEYTATFRLVAVGPLANGEPFCDLQAADRHHYALAVLALFAIVALLVAVLSGSRPAAVAVGIAGLLALLLFVTVDLPKANDVGTVSSSCNINDQVSDAKAVPQAGFWIEMASALALTLSGAALATLSSDQLRGLRPRWLRPAASERQRRAERGEESEKDAG